MDETRRSSRGSRAGHARVEISFHEREKPDDLELCFQSPRMEIGLADYVVF